jgi:hypothetical protein
MVKQLFLKYLTQFELTLISFGYIKAKVEVLPSDIYRENLSVKYLNNQIQTRIVIEYSISGTGKVLLSLFMFKLFSDGTFFSLYDFLDRRNLNDKIKSELAPSEDFEPFVKKYFEDLKSLFENELNDQITGKSFENHIDALRKSMDEY